jgi:hypothetical protein
MNPLVSSVVDDVDLNMASLLQKHLTTGTSAQVGLPLETSVCPVTPNETEINHRRAAIANMPKLCPNAAIGFINHRRSNRTRSVPRGQLRFVSDSNTPRAEDRRPHVAALPADNRYNILHC